MRDLGGKIWIVFVKIFLFQLLQIFYGPRIINAIHFREHAPHVHNFSLVIVVVIIVVVIIVVIVVVIVVVVIRHVDYVDHGDDENHDKADIRHCGEGTPIIFASEFACKKYRKLFLHSFDAFADEEFQVLPRYPKKIVCYKPIPEMQCVMKESLWLLLMQFKSAYLALGCC